MRRHAPALFLTRAFWLLCVLLFSGCSTWSSSPTPEARHAAQAWTALGEEYLVEGDTTSARHVFEHARDFDATQPALWHGLALCAQLEDNWPLAQHLYQQALLLAKRKAENTPEYDREYATLLNNHARLLYDEGAIHEACAEFDKAARRPGGIGNPITAQNSTLCRTAAMEPPPLRDEEHRGAEDKDRHR